MPIDEPFPPGNAVDLTATFKAGGVLTDTTATIKILKPDGTQVSFTGGSLTHPSTGVYTYRYQTLVSDPDGTYYFRGEGTGTVPAATPDDYFKLDRTKFT